MKHFKLIYFLGLLELVFIVSMIVSNNSGITGSLALDVVNNPTLATDCGGDIDVSIFQMNNMQELCMLNNNLNFILENRGQDIQGYDLVLVTENNNLISSTIHKVIKQGDIKSQSLYLGETIFEKVTNVRIIPFIKQEKRVIMCADKVIDVNSIAKCTA